MKNRVLVYGCYGYTGRLIVDELLKLNIKPVLSGRDSDKVKELADRHGLEYDSCTSEELSGLLGRHPDIKVLLNCAGPFRYTAREAIRACIAAGVHYLDITGEIEVFELAASLSKEAEQAGVMLLPGTGFDVVPSDCLAAYMKQRMPEASHLELTLYSKGGAFSHGTAITVVENMGDGSRERMGGKIFVTKSGEKTKTVEIEGKKILTVGIPWGDVSTAWYSTGIPNIAVFNAASPGLIKNMKRSNYLGFILRSRFVKNYLIRQIKKRPAGPDEKMRNTSRIYIQAEVKDSAGNRKVSQLEGPEGYWLTAMTAAAISKEVLNDHFSPGFRTPSLQYGADFILQFPTVSRKDIQ